MNSQVKIAFPAAVLGLLLFAPLAHGQRGGMRGSGGGFHGGSVGGFRGGAVRADRGGEFNREGRRRFFDDGFGFPFAPFYYPGYFSDGYDGYYDSDLDYRAAEPLDPPVQTRPAQVYQPPTPPPVPGDSLILENHDGKWVRIPTGGELVNAAASSSAAAVPAPSAKAPVTAPKAIEMEPPSSVPSPPLPPAVLVFRDGHTEEIQKYMIQGADLYASSAYSATGTWTQKIPLSDLDIPASLKINKDRGTRFNLPSGPNEVVVRF